MKGAVVVCRKFPQLLLFPRFYNIWHNDSCHLKWFSDDFRDIRRRIPYHKCRAWYYERSKHCWHRLVGLIFPRLLEPELSHFLRVFKGASQRVANRLDWFSCHESWRDKLCYVHRTFWGDTNSESWATRSNPNYRTFREFSRAFLKGLRTDWIGFDVLKVEETNCAESIELFEVIQILKVE